MCFVHVAKNRTGYTDSIEYLFNLLKEKRAKNEATILVLDEFDLFATLPKKQTCRNNKKCSYFA